MHEKDGISLDEIARGAGVTRQAVSIGILQVGGRRQKRASGPGSRAMTTLQREMALRMAEEGKDAIDISAALSVRYGTVRDFLAVNKTGAQPARQEDQAKPE